MSRVRPRGHVHWNAVNVFLDGGGGPLENIFLMNVRNDGADDKIPSLPIDIGMTGWIFKV